MYEIRYNQMKGRKNEEKIQELDLTDLVYWRNDIRHCTLHYGYMVDKDNNAGCV